VEKQVKGSAPLEKVTKFQGPDTSILAAEGLRGSRKVWNGCNGHGGILISRTDCHIGIKLVVGKD